MEEDIKKQLKEQLFIEINNLVINKWYFYDQPWNTY